MKETEQVLIVEDDENDAYFIKRAFAAAGIIRPPHISGNGLEAIAYLEGRAEYSNRQLFPYPQWIMTDLKMPVASGFVVLEWLQKHPDFGIIPVVVFTSSTDEKDAKKSYCLGAHACIIKPSDPVEFKEVIQSIVRFWEKCERPRPDVPPSCGQLLEEARREMAR